MVFSFGARRWARVLLASLLVLVLPAGLAAQVVVTPQGTWTSNKTIHTTGYTQTFRVTNETGESQYVEFSCSGQSGVVCTGLNKSSATIPGNSFTNVIATYSTGNEGTGQLTFSAGYEQGWVFVPIVLPAGAPRMSVLPYLEANQDLGRCALGCFTATHAQSTVPYVALDAPRSATLVYHGDRLAPKPFVAVDVWPDTTFGTPPSEYQLQVKVGTSFVTFLNGETLLRFSGTSGSTRYRLAGQFNAATGYTHGTVYPLEILVTAKIGSTLYTNRWITRYLHVNTADTTSAGRYNGIAKGWALAGLQRLIGQSDGSKLILEGNGTAVFFKYDSLTQTLQAPAGEFSTLKASGSTWVRAYPDSTTLTFTSAGLLVKLVDRWGNKDSVVYDGSNRVTQLRDPLGNAITLAYGTNGLTSITDPFGRATTITVDGSKRLTAIQDPDGVSTTFGYDGSNRLQTLTNRAGKTTTLYYHSQSGKLDSIQAPAIPVFGGGTQSPVTRLLAWQQQGVPYGATSGTPFTSLHVDSAYAKITEPGGAVSRFTVNRWGSPARSTNALGEVTTVTYTSHGHPARVDAPGYGAAYDSLAYNASGLVVYSKPAADAATTLQYGGWAQPNLIGKANADTTRFYLGANGRVDSVRVGNLTVQRLSGYDAFGRAGTVTDGVGTTLQTLAYSAITSHRNLATVTLPGSRVTSYYSDAYGRDTLATPPGGPATRTYYSVVNRVDSVKIATSPATVTRYGYDSLYLTSVTDPKNQVYQTVYNALGWAIKSVDPAGGRDSVQYSVDGDVRRTVTRRGLTVDLAYDAVHRPLTQTGSATASWAYSGNGLVVADSSAVSRETVYGNVRGRPDSARTILNGQTYLRRYRYSTAGLLDSLVITGPAGTSFTTRRFVYDTAKGVLKRIELGSQATGFTRDGNLNLTAIALPGGDTVRFTRGSLQAPVKITASPASYNNATEQWLGFDAQGRLDKLHRYPNAKNGRWFQYDSLGRLTVSSNVQRTPENLPGGCPSMDFGMSGACAPQGDYAVMSADTVTYDAVGNRTDKGGTYTTGNRITAFGGCSYATDAEGKVVRRSGSSPCVPIDTLLWTAEGRLDSLQVGSTGVKYLYDASGRLVMRRVNGTAASTFLWDGDDLLAELNGAATAVTAEYSYAGIDRLHALVVNGVKYYAHQDGRGSVIALTDTAQNAVRTYAYDDWGTLTSGTDGLPFSGTDRARWKGALWMGPEADLYYMRNRWYEAGTGRFLSEDPIGLEGGINPVTYADADPINSTDPSGLKTCIEEGYYWFYKVDGKWSYGGRVVTRSYCISDSPGDLAKTPGRGPGTGTGGGGRGSTLPHRAPFREETETGVLECAAQHYNLDDLTDAFGALDAVKFGSYVGALPIPKALVGLPTLPGASHFTNPISLSRFIYGEMKMLRRSSLFRTRSLLTASGRANVVAAAGFVAYDVTSIAACVLDGPRGQ